MSNAQTQMAVEIKDLAKTISKLDVVMEKMINIEERHNLAFSSVDSRMKLLEKAQIEGCPALREVKIDYNGRYEKVITVLNQNRENVEKIQAVVNRVAWGIVTAVGMALIAVVLK
jgi:tetrahydromethanopterin S-methyltransferase subunit B